MKKIYILCPANVVTGGPELLHQLHFQLNNLGYNSIIKYIGQKEGIIPVDKRYEIYNPKYEDYIEDCKENYIIVPEIYINELKKYKHINKIIWWLSVDNYFKSKDRIKNKIKTLNGLLDFNYKKADITHLAQSQYAIEFLKDEGIESKKIYYLSDYLNDKFIEKSKNNLNKEKKNYALYNPKKGFKFTNLIMERGKDINWVPLENLTVDEMSDLMQISKVYIDFGNHPGKDRIPREAAISGCCVITGMKGSAKYKEDVDILDEFKFEDNEKSIDEILKKIRLIFDKYNNENIKFKHYRNKIKNEKQKFEDDVKLVFKEVVK